MPISEWSMLNQYGNPTALNTMVGWDGDLTKLPTGYYGGFVQTSKIQSAYVITKDIPEEVSGNVVLITIVDLGYENRRYYEIRTTVTNRVFTRTTANNEKTPWVSQQSHRLTWDTGAGLHWRWGMDDPNAYPADNLYVDIDKLNTGFYMGAINSLPNGDTRSLPKDAPLGQFYTAYILRSESGRVNITLTAQYARATWVGSTSTDDTNLVWRRLDGESDYLGEMKANFSLKMNKKSTKPFNILAITDTHWQLDAPTTQIAYLNPSHLKNFEDLDRQIFTNDIGVHLGDWTDGNYSRSKHIYSVVDMGAKFFEKPNRYGVIGNHDYNPQWDGNAGNNLVNAGSLDYHVSKDELAPYQTKAKKPYYYEDHDGKKIRMIFLNCFDISEYINPENNRLYQSPQDDYGFGKDQVNWFIKTLKEVPKGYDVVIFMHDVFDGVYENRAGYKNGDAMRIIAEGYQNKLIVNKITTDIGISSPEWDYYNIGSCQNCLDMSQTNGKILGVFAGHRHRDMSIFKNGIRYVNLLCSRPNGSNTTQAPPRTYWANTEEAITFIQVDKANERIICYRCGAGNDYTYNMFGSI